MRHSRWSRREILTAGSALLAGACLGVRAGAEEQPEPRAWDGPIIDIHQHTNYRGRPDDALVHHQRRMGVTQTILLPAGSPVDTPATHQGRAAGLYAGAGGMDSVSNLAREHPGELHFFANEVPDLPEARQTLDTWIRRGAIGIGEQKFHLPVDGPEMDQIYELAQEHDVPVLMHIEFDRFNTGYERFGNVLRKWERVKFIGHAVGFWAHVSAEVNPAIAYPKEKVKPGGLTDRYLGEYPNLYADMSATSGLTALIRDEDHARGFIERHQNKLIFGSDCPDRAGHGPTCIGSSLISAIVRLSPSRDIASKLLHDNAKKLLKL